MIVRIGVEVAGLATDLWLPDGAACTVLVRTPYGTAGLWPEAAAYAAAGHAVVLQDVRGRFRSAGVFAPGADETADGRATVDWIVAQPWSGGRVVLAGTGYEAYTAWCAAGHPAVSAVISRQPWPPEDPAPPLDAELWWRTEHGTGRFGHPGLTELFTIPESAGGWPVDVRPWPPAPGQWSAAGRRVADAVAGCTAPSLHLGSWYCRSAAATLRHAAAAARSTCVVGGWVSPLTHQLAAECAIEVPADPDPLALSLDWLAGRVSGDRILWLGSGRWSPPARGTRTDVPIVGTGPVTLTADPDRPVPSRPHSADLAPLTGVRGAAVWTAAAPPAWLGVAACAAAGHADAPAQLVTTLVHETPAGVRTMLTDGLITVGPGAFDVRIDCRPVAAELPPGHRLALELTTGRYPRHPRPPGPATVTVEALTLQIPAAEG